MSHTPGQPAPAERTEAQPGVPAVLAGLLDNVLGNVFNDFHSDRDLIDSEDVRHEFAAALAAAGQGTTQPAPAAVINEGTCPECRHASHEGLGWCPNLASDNDCACRFPPTQPAPASDDAALRERVRDALESLDDLCRDEDRHGSSIRAHEVRGAVADLRAVVADAGVRDA